MVLCLYSGIDIQNTIKIYDEAQRERFLLLVSLCMGNPITHISF